jgi:hypothetical protein
MNANVKLKGQSSGNGGSSKVVPINTFWFVVLRREILSLSFRSLRHPYNKKTISAVNNKNVAYPYIHVRPMVTINQSSSSGKSLLYQ